MTNMRFNVRGLLDPVVHAVSTAPSKTDPGVTVCGNFFTWDRHSGIGTDEPVTCLECWRWWRPEDEP